MKYLFFLCLLNFPFWLKAQNRAIIVRPIDLLNSKDSTVWLQHNFAQIVKNKRIVGLGEVCHGGHEIVEVKAKLLRYLVTYEGYRQLLFEAADIGLRELNNYLINGEVAMSQQTIDSLLVNRNKIQGSRSIVNAEEIKSVFLWIKGYNIAHPNDQVTLRGIDISGINYNYIKTSYFSRRDLKKIQQKWGTGTVSILLAEQIVQDWYNQSKDSLQKVYTSEQLQNLQLDLRDFFNLARYQLNGGEKSSAMMTLRDSLMTFNLNELLHGKAIVWAHDVHVANSGFNSGLFHAKMLGNFLKEKYGASYFILLTDFSNTADLTVSRPDGTFDTRRFHTNKKASASILSQKYNMTQGLVFAKDTDTLSANSGYNSIGASGSQNFVSCSASGFDALLFLDKISPAHL